jgi:RNA polymerase sigma-70 factor, ECF subfamily
MTRDEINELIHKSRQNDFTAFQKLVEQYQYMVYKLTFRLLASEEDAKDMVQEVFIRIWEKLSTFNTNFSFSSWVYKIATNMCYDMLKSKQYKEKKQVIELQAGIHNPELKAGNVESGIMNRELAELIRFLTDELSPKQKLVFTLSDIEDLEVQEISEITGLSPGKIKSNLYLARKYIRKRIEMTEQEDDDEKQ